MYLRQSFSQGSDWCGAHNGSTPQPWHVPIAVNGRGCHYAGVVIPWNHEGLVGRGLVHTVAASRCACRGCVWWCRAPFVGYDGCVERRHFRVPGRPGRVAVGDVRRGHLDHGRVSVVVAVHTDGTDDALCVCDGAGDGVQARARVGVASFAEAPAEAGYHDHEHEQPEQEAKPLRVSFLPCIVIVTSATVTVGGGMVVATCALCGLCRRHARQRPRAEEDTAERAGGNGRRWWRERLHGRGASAVLSRNDH